VDLREAHALLGVEPGVDADTLRAAFRAKARTHHPDARPDDPNAGDTFRRLREAYQLLRSRASARASMRSDRASDAAPRGGDRAPDPSAANTASTAGAASGERRSVDPDDPTSADWAKVRARDVFERFRQKREQARYGSTPFGRRSDAPDEAERAVMFVPFEAAITGGEHLVSVDFGHGVTKLRVTLPAGLEEDQRFRVDGRMVRARVGAHAHLRRDGQDVLLDLPLTLVELVRGARVRVPTAFGSVEIQVPRGARPGQKLRLRGRGVGGQGDQLCTLALAPLPTGPDAEHHYVALDALRVGPARPWDDDVGP
jgi:DnaJ-class molecular chaperone